MQKFIALFSLLLTFFSFSIAQASDYRLGIVLVIDQFRADYLMRFKDDFIKPNANGGGFRFLMENGAYFPIADHELFQNMTGPGHAAILSGSYPYRNGIGINEWFDRESGKNEYCVRDNNAKLIGSNGPIEGKPGVSPKNFNATTLGDELKNVDRPSRVVSIALKDRASVLLGGKRADVSIWLESSLCQWVSSSFYVSQLPAFVKNKNEKLTSLTSKMMSWGPYQNTKYCSTEALQTPWAIQETFDLALDAVEEMKLGQGKDTDLLTISLSSHDYLGHRLGPNDAALKAMTLEEDKKIASFLSAIAKKVPGGLKNVFIVLTGDHGIPPSPKSLPKERMPNENLDANAITQSIENAFTEIYGKPSEGKWIEKMTELEIYLSLKSLKAAKVTASEAIRAVRPRLTRERYIDQIWSRDDILIDRKVPAGEYGRVIDRSINARSGELLIVLNPYFYSDGYPITHMTHYSYDRYVPLIFWGKSFKAGTYRQTARIVDIAPTLSSVLKVLPPNQSEGRVLTEILK